MSGWGGASQITNVVVEGNQLWHLNPPESSFFPGRLFVSQSYVTRNVYIGGNTNHQAGPGVFCDQNQGEQVLFETTDSDNTLRVIAVVGTNITVRSTTPPSSTPSPGIELLYNRVGLADDGSTTAEAWSYISTIGALHVQQGTGAGQYREIVGGARDADGQCVLVLDRPFTVDPDADSSVSCCN